MAANVDFGRRSFAFYLDGPRSGITFSVLLLVLFLLFASCRKEDSSQAADSAFSPEEALSVAVSIHPYALLAKEIGGSRITVRELMSGALSPHVYSPRMSDLQMLGEADVFLLNGAGLEGSLESILPSLKTSLSVADILRVSAAEASKTDSRLCEHAPVNPHFWFSPEAMKITAASLAETLALLDSGGSELYRKNAVLFAEKIDQTVEQIRESRKKYPENFSYLTMHDSYAYLNEILALEAFPVETSPGREPSAKTVAALLDTVRTEGVRFLVLDPQTEGRSARRIAAATGLKATVIDPLGNDYRSFFDYYRLTWEKLTEAYDSN